jgi:hypothetical protein
MDGGGQQGDAVPADLIADILADTADGDGVRMQEYDECREMNHETSRENAGNSIRIAGKTTELILFRNCSHHSIPILDCIRQRTNYGGQ